MALVEEPTLHCCNRCSAVLEQRPLDTEGVLWVAALDLVPIGSRIEWVAKMVDLVEQINEVRANAVPEIDT